MSLRFLMSDLAMKCFYDAPKDIQRKYLAFRKKFQDNNKSTGLNLERIFDTKTEGLYSARIDQDWRALLLNMQDSWVVVYLNKHDDAYKWAVNRNIVWNEHIQCIQCIPVMNMEPESSEPAGQNSWNRAPNIPKSASLDADSLQNENSSSAPTSSAPDASLKAGSSLAEEPSMEFEQASDEQLLELGVPEEMLAEVRRIHTFDELDNFEKRFLRDSLPDLFEVLFRILDGEKLENVRFELREGRVNSDALEDKLNSNNNRRHIVVDDERLLPYLENGDKFYAWQLFLHPNQRKLTDNDFKGSFKVSGSAGTGKTVVALHRLRYLAAKEGAHVLFTTFTKALCDNLKTIISQLGVDKDTYTLCNIDKLAMQMAKDHPEIFTGVYSALKNGFKVIDYQRGQVQAYWEEVLDSTCTKFTPEFLMSEHCDVLLFNDLTGTEPEVEQEYYRTPRLGRRTSLNRRQKQEVWKLITTYRERLANDGLIDRQVLFNLLAAWLRSDNGEHKFTNVIADEFQDFSNPELRFLRALVLEGQNDLFLTGDPFQRIYDRSLNFKAAGIDIRGRSRVLKVNYRTTEEIRRAAVATLRGESYDSFDEGEESREGYVSLMHGVRPDYEFFQTAEQEAKAVVNFVRSCHDGQDGKEGLHYNEICVAMYSGQVRRTVVMREALEKAGIPIRTSLAERAGSTNDGAVLFCTFHALKGLEFKAAAITGVSEDVLPTSMNSVSGSQYSRRLTEGDIKINRSLLYVAISRACQAVYITGWGKEENRCPLLPKN